MKDYCKELDMIMQNADKLVRWEEISSSYCEMLSGKVLNKDMVALVYTSDVDISYVSFCKRYMKSHGMSVVKIFYLDLNDLSVSAEALEELYEIMQKGEYLVFRLFKIRISRKLQMLAKSLMGKGNIKYYKMEDQIERKVSRIAPPFYRARGAEIFEYVNNHLDEIKRVLELLADTKSKETLIEIIRVAVTNDVYRLEQGTMEDKYWECYRHLDDECFVNCGSAKGDTLLMYLLKGYAFKKIYAYEGSLIAFRKLKRNISCLPGNIRKKVILKNEFIGTGKSKNNFDHTFKKENISLINFDIEGAEMAVLRGGAKLIQRNRPVLAVAAYHKASDLVEIPNFVRKTANDYVFYLRKYCGAMPNVLNEYVYYAVPKERTL